MSGAKWACFLGLPTISSYILLHFVKSIYNPWNRLFFSSCPLFFTHLYTYTCFFDVCFCFLGTGGFRTQIRSARFYRFFCFVCLFVFLFSPLWLLVFIIYTIDQFSQGDMLLPLLTFDISPQWAFVSASERLPSIFGVSDSVKLAVWSVVRGVRWCMLSALGGPLHWSWPPCLWWMHCFGL